jgi:hypothetical protein
MIRSFDLTPKTVTAPAPAAVRTGHPQPAGTPAAGQPPFALVLCA